jgi:GAF domain-containing protein
MRRRPGTSDDETVKARRRKAATLKRLSGPKTVRRRSSTAAEYKSEIARLTRALSEALEQQTATSEILSVISRSHFKLQPVLQSVVNTAMRLCRAQQAVIYRQEQGTYRFVAGHSTVSDYLDIEKETVILPGKGTVVGRAALTKQVARINDAWNDRLYEKKRDAKIGGVRSMIGVPLLREGETIGVIALARNRVEPFIDREIELVATFADQAVIAIENVRLFEAEQQRSRELSESLEQQTATSAVLQVISNSPGETKPVFKAILANATRICEAEFGVLHLSEGDLFRTVAFHNAPPAYVDAKRRDPMIRHLPPNSALAQLKETRLPVQIADVRQEPVYNESHTDNTTRVAFTYLTGVRSLLAIPMVNDEILIGAIMIYRQEVRPFTEKQIELMQSFAAQAVIAIENARLLNELRQRTDDLSESLEQQTATSEVLRVISSSPGELQPVFEAMLANATRLCQASYGNMLLWEGDAFRMAALHGDLPAVVRAAWQPGNVFRPRPDVPIARMAQTREAVQVADLREDRGYASGDPLPVLAVDVAGVRSLIAIPMLKESDLVGAIFIYRKEVRPFTDKQIELVTNFAAQAVIAIENVRLLNELRESLQQQTATAEVLAVISRSAFDLQPVFETVAESSVRLCGADRAFIFRFDRELLRMVAAYNAPPHFKKWVEQHPIRPGRHSGSARAALERRTIHIPDVLADPEYSYGAKDVEAIRTVLGVPILKSNDLLGVMMIYHLEVRPFTDKQIALVETFADQAAIAIENVRLFNDVQKGTQELTESLRQQTATADVLKVISRSAFDLRMVLDTLLQSAAQLCEADQGTITQRKGDTFYRSVSYGFPTAFAEYVKDRPVELGRDTATGRALLEGRVIHIPDVQADADYTWNEAQRLGGFRTLLGVPMLRESVPVGVLTLTRTDVRPFTDKQIELVSTFADQAAIAIETCGCSRVWRRAHANWLNRWMSCRPRKTA